MNHSTLLSFSLFAVAFSAFAQAPKTLSESEKQDLTTKAMIIAEATKAEQADPVIALTHPAIYQLMGGEENFKKLTQQAFASFDEIGLVFESYETGEPMPLYTAGAEEICFLPTTAVLSVRGKRVKSRGYLVCIRTIGIGEWKFLDGAGFKENPNLLWDLFPDLSKDATAPEQSLEAL